MRKTRDKRDEIRRDLCNGIDPAANRLETHVFPYVGQTSAARIAGADPLAVLRRVESRGTFELAYRERSICSRVLRYARAAERQCRDVAADLITLLVPVEAEPMAAVIAYSQVAANPLRPRAVNRRTLAINTVARRAADWMDAARFVLLGFLYEGRGRTIVAM